MVSLQTSLDAVSDTKKLRSQSCENNELQLQVVDLLNELAEVREAKETLRVEFEQQERIHKRQLLDEVANGKQMCADRDGYKTRVKCLEAEVKDMASRNERLVDEAQRESKEFVDVRNRLEETVNGYAIESSDLKKAFLKEKAEMSNSVDDTKKKNHELKRYDMELNSPSVP
jgi:SHS2 domain-containing protein